MYSGPSMSLSHNWILFFTVYVFHIFFIHSYIYEHLCCFSTLTIVNTKINMEGHVSCWILFSFALGIYPEMELLDVADLIFNLLGNLHIVSHSGWSNVHFHQQYLRVPFSPHPCQHQLSPVSLMIASLTGGFVIKVMQASEKEFENVSFSLISGRIWKRWLLPLNI